MSHDRGCFHCGRDRWDYDACKEKDCPKRDDPVKPQEERVSNYRVNPDPDIGPAVATNANANARQVGGKHYSAQYQHWDFIEEHGIGYLEGCATKYVTRYRLKSGLQDLEKAVHYVEKLMELVSADKRRPRGSASMTKIMEFSEANDLNATAESCIIYLSTWKNADDLRQARAAILRLMVKVREEKPGYELAPPKPSPVYLDGADQTKMTGPIICDAHGCRPLNERITGQEHPFGFNPEQDVVKP